jgi:mono/diheme cytochrome c family protein
MKWVLSLIGVLLMASCEPSGQRSAESTPIRPDQVTDFSFLYGHNCAGCHGRNGRGGVATELGNPVYLAIAGDAVIRRVASEGRPGTAMTAFSQKHGGLLTEDQIEVIVNGIRTHWAKADAVGDAHPPAYESHASGDPAHGETVYNTNCGVCHGLQGHKGSVGSITDATFLALVSDQYLRTTIIAGIPAVGMPDWRAHPKPLTDDDVTDVVAWLASQRPRLYLTDTHPSGGNQ